MLRRCPSRFNEGPEDGSEDPGRNLRPPHEDTQLAKEIQQRAAISRWQQSLEAYRCKPLSPRHNVTNPLLRSEKVRGRLSPPTTSALSIWREMAFAQNLRTTTSHFSYVKPLRRRRLLGNSIECVYRGTLTSTLDDRRGIN